jgi:hypothetical protein
MRVLLSFIVPTLGNAQLSKPFRKQTFCYPSDSYPMLRYRLRTLLIQFSLRDLLWLTAVIGLIAVWRTDVARQETVYREMLRFRMGHDSHDLSIIWLAAKQHPELLTELKAYEATNNQNLSEKASLNHRFYKLVNKAESLYKHDLAIAGTQYDESN